MKLLGIALALVATFPSSAGAQSEDSSVTVTAARWNVARAEQLQRRAQADMARSVGLRLGSKAKKEEEDRIEARETGFGVAAHAPPDVRLKAQERLLRIFMSRLLEDEPDVSSFADLERELGLVPFEVIPAATVSMSLKTNGQGPVTGGGFVWTFDPDSHEYLGGSYIGSGGGITISVAAGTEMDIMVFVNPPFAQQKVASVVSAPGLQVVLKDAVNVPVYVRDLNGTILTGVSTDITLRRIDYSTSDWPAGTVNGSGSVPLAPGESYQLTAVAPPPYLSGRLEGISSAYSELNVPLEEGVRLTFNFEDPMGLLGQSGCVGSGWLSVYRSIDNLRHGALLLTEPEAIFDGPHLVGFEFAAPDSEAIDYEVRFDSGGGSCQLQDIRQRFAWFSGDQIVNFNLAPRPRPNVLFKTPGGADIPWSWGVVHPTDPMESASYFSPGESPSLAAGKHYSLNLSGGGDYSVSEALFKAHSGAFDVLVQSEPLTLITSMITIDGAYIETALIEFYRSGVLEEAFEFSGSQLTIEIPAGTYDVRVSGLSGNWFDSATGRNYSIFLKPFTVARAFSGAGGETMNFHLSRPAAGIHFSLPSDGVRYLVTALESGVPVASKTVYPGNGGILTDLNPLDLVIRGPGYDDTAFSANPTGGVPFADIAALQGPIGRLTGVFRDPDGQPIEDAWISLYSEDGLFSDWVGSTSAIGEFDVPKIRSGLYFFRAPDGGDSIMQFRETGNPAANEDVEVTLERLSFHPVSEGGPTVQLLYGTGDKGYKIAILAEGYTSARESFTDSNGNQAWDAALFMDLNLNGVWDRGEPAQGYGERTFDSSEYGTDITASNEPFADQNGDGYPSIDDFSVFVQNSKNYIRSLLGTPAIRDNIDFDVYIVFLPSPQAGLGAYNAAEEKIIDFNTLFDGAYRMNRSLLSIDYEAAAAALDTHVPDRDLQIVMINMPVRAGRANSYILAYGGVGNSSPNNFVAGHEFGHNPGGLADEYNEFNGTSKSYFPPSLKHLTHRTVTPTVPWFGLLGSRQDLPVSVPNSPGNGVYAGGHYNNGGVFRSTSNSRMRYNAPLFNDISLEVFSFSLCLRSLTNGDLKLVPVIFADRFEDSKANRGVFSDICR